ncbi:hypothetical protein [Tautonia plasticadhaerens]|uniref:Tim44-like domain protein n=1 Tax=Tautonia plasticadhaerens TaxID=2527974 RepID=A0A518HBD0_9BACT|nr:hypothetical protein [Tautonia plasticadhaerens]QDV38168.1 hypothetical protein ElP_61180 [Tautonia plasticadhaerens]
MRRTIATRGGLPAVALSVLMAGCGGGSGGGDETPVVDMRDPSFSGPGGGAPAPAAAPPAQAAPVPGAPAGFAPAGPAGGMVAENAPRGGTPIGGPAAAVAGSGGPVAGGASAPVAPTPTGGGAAAGDLALNEMLSAANAANDPGAARGQSDSSGAPSQGSGPPGRPGDPGSSGMMAMMAGQGGMMGPNSSGSAIPGMAPGMAPGPGRGGSEYGEYGMQGPSAGQAGQFGPGGQGGFEGGFGGQPGMLGPGAGGAAEPADFESPQGAVEAFLAAIEAKDIQRLQEATALRAPQQAETAARRKAFQAIREMSLTPEEFDTIAENMDGFEIARMGRATEVGMLSFILQKEGEFGSTLLRTIDVRKERSGWKVLDVSGISEIKALGGRAREQAKNKNQGGSGNN